MPELDAELMKNLSSCILLMNGSKKRAHRGENDFIREGLQPLSFFYTMRSSGLAGVGYIISES